MDSPRTPETTLSSDLRTIINDRNILTTRTRMKVLSALDEIHQESEASKQVYLRSAAIQEILTSEVKYLHQLELVMKFFMQPMIEKELLNHASYTTLFGNIETLYNVNGELLRELKHDPENVARAFYKLAPFFKLYSVYAYDYKQSLILLQETIRNDRAVADFIAGQETRPEVGLKLSALLIAPIQRVPRYRLLLQEVLRRTPPRHKDYNILRASLVEVERTADHINALVAEYEDTQKLLELQKRIASPINLVRPGRKLLRQGPLMRVSRRGNSSYRRHFVLLSDTLLYCKGDPEQSLTVCCLLPLNKCKVQRVLSGGLFRVTCLQEMLLLYSENGDSEAWIGSLQDAVKKYVECRQTLRKDSSSRKPLRNNNVNQFPPESIAEKRCKRKRAMPTVDPNTSAIVYINRDCEDEGSSEKVSVDCFPFGRSKRLKTDDTSKYEKGKSAVENQAPFMDSLYPLRSDIEKLSSAVLDTPQYSTTLINDLRAPRAASKPASTDGARTNAKDRHESSGREFGFSDTTREQGRSSLNAVAEFFFAIGASFRDFFKLR